MYMSHYIHHVPGRLRITSTVLKRNEAEAKEVCRFLSSTVGVLGCEVKTLTGSAVISYDIRVITADQLIALLKEQGIVADGAAIPVPQKADNLTEVLTKVGSVAGKALFGVVLEKAIERSAVALVGALL
jgi:Heavy metal associated domain 2